MANLILNDAHDPMGAAIFDYYHYGKADTLHVFSSLMEEDEIPVSELFRDFNSMPYLEQVALQYAHGHILDVGAGSGCHSLALIQMEKQPYAIDISPLAVSVMRARGVNAHVRNFFDSQFQQKFDTILLLMNGSGIIGRLENINTFFSRVRQLLNPHGFVLMDSTDVRYLFEEEDGSIKIDLADDYYGQFDFKMCYKNIIGKSFDWLYIDFETLSYYAEMNGFWVEYLAKGSHYDYLAKIYPSN